SGVIDGGPNVGEKQTLSFDSSTTGGNFALKLGPFQQTVPFSSNPGTLQGNIQTALNNMFATQIQTLTLAANGNVVLSYNGVNSAALSVTTGGSGTSLAAVQTALNSIPALAGNFQAFGGAGGPFTIVLGLEQTNFSNGLLAILIPIGSNGSAT